MARSIVADLLQVYPFWLMEASPIDPLSLPMLTPLFGFSSITAPEITVDVREINEANWIFKKKIIKGGDVTAMTLERGLTFYDSDFWRWIYCGISGNASTFKFGAGPITIPIGGLTPRRSLLLVQFITRMPFALPAGSDAIVAAATKVAIQTAGAALAGASAGDLAGSVIQNSAFAALGALGPFEFAARLPAKAWMLHGCIPTRYKVGGDFDASSSAVSIQQLEIQPEMMEEVSLVA